MSIPNLTKDLAVIQKLSDLPNATEGLTAEQLKAKFDEAALEIQNYINDKLIPAILATNVPFTATVEIPADNVDAAIREVQEQVRDASSGTIVNGSVTTEKLSAALLARTYGGRPWVSMNTPDSSRNVAADFPVGQIWLRTSFVVSNQASDTWVANGCTVAKSENKLTVTGNQTVTATSVTQGVTGLGQDGDRVYVLFAIENRDADITALTVSLNSGEAQDITGGVATGTLVGGSLTVQFAATWPSTSVANGSYEVVNFAIVNVDQMVRQAAGAEEIADWTTYLQSLLPLSSYTSPEEAFIQTDDGVWWPLSYSVQPVSRGGTGTDTVAYGELLYGSGNEELERLGTPENNNSFLQFADGRPNWKTMDEVAAVTGAARIATGTYRGTGGGRSMSLPVTPKLLHISTPSGCYAETAGHDGLYDWADRPCTLAQGCTDTAQYGERNSGSTSAKTQTVRLNGSTVSFSRTFCNRGGVTYNWVAIY